MSRIANNFPGSGAYVSTHRFDASNVHGSHRPDGGSQSGAACHAYTPPPAFLGLPVRLPAQTRVYHPHALGCGWGSQGRSPFGASGAKPSISGCRGGYYSPPPSAWTSAVFRPGAYFGQTGADYTNAAMRYAEKMFASSWMPESVPHGFVPGFGQGDGAFFGKSKKGAQKGPGAQLIQTWIIDARPCPPPSGSKPRGGDKCDGGKPSSKPHRGGHHDKHKNPKC